MRGFWHITGRVHWITWRTSVKRWRSRVNATHTPIRQRGRQSVMRLSARWQKRARAIRRWQRKQAIRLNRCGRHSSGWERRGKTSRNWRGDRNAKSSGNHILFIICALRVLNRQHLWEREEFCRVHYRACRYGSGSGSDHDRRRLKKTPQGSTSSHRGQQHKKMLIGELYHDQI